MNIILIGFASSGKTATGAALACQTGYSHVDLDRAMEDRYRALTGKTLTCRELFRTLGMQGFVELECATVKALPPSDTRILSTGGHAAIAPLTREALRGCGFIVYLRTAVSALRERMAKKGVPISFPHAGDDAALAAEWTRRDPLYRSCADAEIDNTSLSVEETAQAVATVYLTHGHSW